MSSDAAGGYADVVSDDFVAEIAPAEMAGLIEALHTAEDGPEMVANALMRQDFDAVSEETKMLYESLQIVFKAKTGLSLYINYLGLENASSYSEVTGMYYSVEDVYQLTLAGKKYEDKITRAFYAVFC